MKLSHKVEFYFHRLASPTLLKRLIAQRDRIPKHWLPTPLIVSLTSYRPRFEYLHLALLSLLNQTIRPDRVVLWVAQDEIEALPPRIASLAAAGLEIRGTTDLKSYKKLIPALYTFPGAYIATADDDVIYPRNWLELLCLGQKERQGVITCHRAHRVPQPESGKLRPYHEWEWDVFDSAAARPSTDLVATGVGGILYPPNAFHPDITNNSVFSEICPEADDMWFYWMARRAGSLYLKVGSHFRMMHLPGSIDDGLFARNVNDPQIDNLLQKFGNPLEM